MADIFVVLGRRIRAERAARHLTQQQLADAAQVDMTHLSRIESGKATPSLNAVKRIADALELPISKLFDDIPAAKVRDQGYAGTISHLVRDVPERKRAKVLRALKVLLED